MYTDLVIGTDYGYVALPITKAWASILKSDKGLDNLRTLVANNGIMWDRVIYAKIEEQDSEGFRVQDLL